MNKKKKRNQLRKIVENAVLLDEINRRIEYAKTHQIKENLHNIGTTHRGLSLDEMIKYSGVK